MKQGNQTRVSTPTADVEPSQAIRRLAAAIALHAERSSAIKTELWNTSATPALGNRAKLAETLSRMPNT